MKSVYELESDGIWKLIMGSFLFAAGILAVLSVGTVWVLLMLVGAWCCRYACGVENEEAKELD